MVRSAFPCCCFDVEQEEQRIDPLPPGDFANGNGNDGQPPKNNANKEVKKVFADRKVLDEVRLLNPSANCQIPDELAPLRGREGRYLSLLKSDVIPTIFSCKQFVVSFVLVLFDEKTPNDANTIGQKFVSTFANEFPCNSFVESMETLERYSRTFSILCTQEGDDKNNPIVPPKTKTLLLAVFMYADNLRRIEIAHKSSAFPDMNNKDDVDMLRSAMQHMEIKFSPLTEFGKRAEVIRRLNDCTRQVYECINDVLERHANSNSWEPRKDQFKIHIDIEVCIRPPSLYQLPEPYLVPDQYSKPELYKARKHYVQLNEKFRYKDQVIRSKNVPWVVNGQTTVKKLLEMVSAMLTKTSPYEIVIHNKSRIDHKIGTLDSTELLSKYRYDPNPFCVKILLILANQTVVR